MNLVLPHHSLSFNISMLDPKF